MLTKGQAVKVTIHLNEDTRSHVEPLWSVVFSFLKQKRVAGASVLRPEAGFGSHNAIHDVKSEYQGDHLPIRIEFIESPARVDELLPTLYELVTDGLIETQPVTVIKNCASGRDFAGATVFRGVLGYGVKKHTHRSGLLPFSRDLPIVISVVERADRLEELLNAVTALLQDGLIAVSDIDMYRTLVPPPAPQRER
jgi:PII-like signaling protein